MGWSGRCSGWLGSGRRWDGVGLRRLVFGIRYSGSRLGRGARKLGRRGGSLLGRRGGRFLCRLRRWGLAIGGGSSGSGIDRSILLGEVRRSGRLCLEIVDRILWRLELRVGVQEER